LEIAPPQRVLWMMHLDEAGQAISISVVSKWCQKAPAHNRGFFDFLRFAGPLWARSAGLEPATF
jgi:hypothetical protein